MSDRNDKNRPKQQAAPSSPGRPSFFSLVWQGLITGVLILIGLALVLACGAMGVYAYYARTLPSPQELYERTSDFKSARIYDRNGELLFEFFDPTAGRRTVVHYDELPETLIAAVVATEDATFFTNPGINPLSVARALVQNLQEGEMLIGGSTITQQVVKNVFLTDERTLERKIQEVILATEITRRYSKEEILEVYLNEVYLGNLAYGVGAASQTYFGKDVSRLELHEAALLAGLIQAPAYYDPYSNPELALERRQIVLGLMERRGYITPEEAQAANAQPLGVVPNRIYMEAPHAVMYVRQQLEALYGEERIYRDGLQVYTSLDLRLQTLAEEAISAHRTSLAEQGAYNAAVVAMDPVTGDILAMVGSADFWDEDISGQVNMALSPRQPGSTIKPLTYLAALEHGWTAATMLMDVPLEFSDGANPPYRPANYDNKFWGAISLRTALASSRNVPAVYTLNQLGLPALLEVAARLGITTLNRSDYGLSLTLGGGEVPLLEMTGAFAALANGGKRVEPRIVLRIEDQEGTPLFQADNAQGPVVVDPRHAYILTDILADNAARAPAFGVQNPLALPFPAAAKTGTTNDYRDSWTVGYTPDLAAGVWVGNTDNTPMQGVTGSRGAGLIWNTFMINGLGEGERPTFPVPDGLVRVEVCALSGYLPGEHCPERREEIFTAETAPSEPCPMHVRERVCLVSGGLATEYCPPESVEERPFVDYGPEWDWWAQSTGEPIPPREVCPLHTSDKPGDAGDTKHNPGDHGSDDWQHPGDGRKN